MNAVTFSTSNPRHLSLCLLNNHCSKCGSWLVPSVSSCFYTEKAKVLYREEAQILCKQRSVSAVTHAKKKPILPRLLDHASTVWRMGQICLVSHCCLFHCISVSLQSRGCTDRQTDESHFYWSSYFSAISLHNMFLVAHKRLIYACVILCYLLNSRAHKAATQCLKVQQVELFYVGVCLHAHFLLISVSCNDRLLRFSVLTIIPGLSLPQLPSTLTWVSNVHLT